MKLSDVGQLTQPGAVMVGNEVRVGDAGIQGGTVVSISPGSTTVVMESQQMPLGPGAMPAAAQDVMAQQAAFARAQQEEAMRREMAARQMASQQNLVQQQMDVDAQRRAAQAEAEAVQRQMAAQEQQRAQAEANRIGMEARQRQEREAARMRAEALQQQERAQADASMRAAETARAQADARAAAERLDRERNAAAAKRAQESERQREVLEQQRIAQQLQDEHSKLKLMTPSPDRAPAPLTAQGSSAVAARQPGAAPMPVEQYREGRAPLQVSTQSGSGGTVTSVEPPTGKPAVVTGDASGGLSTGKLLMAVGVLVAVGLVMAKNKK